MAAALFPSAGTPRYSQAWIYLALFGVSSLAITLYLMKKEIFHGGRVHRNARGAGDSIIA